MRRISVWVGNKKITVDVRVVAATNQDLELAVKEGRFRKDLFHRLSQFQLRVPPLRERPEDIAALARHFLSLKAANKTFTPDALVVLQGHSWPGNIRELRNLVAKLAMSGDGRADNAAREVDRRIAWRNRVGQRTPRAQYRSGNLDNMEEQMIIRALEQTGGHRAQAAEQLGISRRTLSRKLREYEIDYARGWIGEALAIISEEQQKFFRSKVRHLGHAEKCRRQRIASAGSQPEHRRHGARCRSAIRRVSPDWSMSVFCCLTAKP